MRRGQSTAGGKRVVCHARGAGLPLSRCSQFHAGAALTARKALDASVLYGSDEQMFGAK